MIAKQNIDWSLIRTLAQYSEQAYSRSTAADAATDAQALVLPFGNDIVVAFRGSSSPEDFLQDAKFDQVPFTFMCPTRGARVHCGFLQDYSALSLKVVIQLREFIRLQPTAKIFITGHSLGGGIAILCAFALARKSFQVHRVITFGQPRVGNAAFKKFYNETVVENFGCAGISLGEITHHVVNANDPVPLLPPLLNGYRDEGNEIYLPHTPGYLVNPSIGLQLFDDVMGCFDSWRRGKLAFIPHHFIAAYQERIKDL